MYMFDMIPWRVPPVGPTNSLGEAGSCWTAAGFWPVPLRPGFPGGIGPERQELISRIETYMQDEITAAQFYQELIPLATDPRVREYLVHAMEDEQKHYRLLGELYRSLTGRVFEAQPERVTYRNLVDGLLIGADDEIEAYEAYRDEYLRQQDPRVRDLFFELLTDEMEHAVRFNTALHMLRLQA